MHRFRPSLPPHACGQMNGVEERERKNKEIKKKFKEKSTDQIIRVLRAANGVLLVEEDLDVLSEA